LEGFLRRESIIPSKGITNFLNGHPNKGTKRIVSIVDTIVKQSSGQILETGRKST